MKKWLLFTCIIICAVISSCKKPGDRYCCSIPPPIGVYGQKDGKDWRATAITDTSVHSTIYLYAKTDSDMLKFELITNNNYNTSETPNVYDASYYVTSNTYGKLTYLLDKSAANDIKVAYSKGEKVGNIPNVWVTSNFSLVFKLATPIGNAAFDSKRVTFSNSTIHYGLQN